MRALPYASCTLKWAQKGWQHGQALLWVCNAGIAAFSKDLQHIVSSTCVGSSCYLQQHAVTCGAMPWGTLQQDNLSSLPCSKASCVHIAVRCWLSTGCVQSMTTRASSILSLQRTQVCSIFQEPATWSEQCLCRQQLLSTWRSRRFVLQVLGQGCSNISKSLPCSQTVPCARYRVQVA